MRWNISNIDRFALRHDRSSLSFNDQGGSRHRGIGKDESNEEKDYDGGGGGGGRDLHIFLLG